MNGHLRGRRVPATSTALSTITRRKDEEHASSIRSVNPPGPLSAAGRWADITSQLADVAHDVRSVDITGVHEGRVPRAHLPRRRQVPPQIRSDTSGGDSSEAEACTNGTRTASS